MQNNDLISRKALMESLYSVSAPTPDESYIVEKCINKVNDAPAVDAVVLPCKVGTQIWLTKWRCSGMHWTKQKKLNEPIPRTIHHFDITKDGVFAHFKDGCIPIEYFGEIVFLMRKEAETALARMKG